MNTRAVGRPVLRASAHDLASSSCRRRADIVSRRNRLLPCALALLGLMLGCQELPPSPVSKNAPEVTRILSSDDGLPTLVRDDESSFADLARSAPSSAGFFLDSAGTVSVWVRNSLDGAAAQANIRRQLVSGRIAPRERGVPISQVRVLNARFTFKQLATLRDLAFDNVLGRVRGVNSLDLDERRNRVTLGLDSKTFASARAQVIPRVLAAGGDTSALAFDSVGAFREDMLVVPPDSITNQSSDPLFGGLAIALEWSATDYHACTLGFVAQRNSTLGLVSASHCTSGMYGPDNNPVHQTAGRRVATETVDAYGYTCGFLSECRGADAFFAPSNNAIGMAVGLIARTTFSNGGGLSGGNGSRLIDQAKPYWMVTAEENNDLYVGSEVQKVGITTGWTHGAIKATCVDYYPRNNYLLRCGYEAWYVADKGDSGGPVFQILDWVCSSCVKLVGIHSGREQPGNDQAVFSKLTRIKSDLGGTWTVQRGYSLSTPTVSGSMGANSHPYLQWNAVAGATRYQVYATYWQYICNGQWGCEWTAQQTSPVGQTTGTNFTHSAAVVTSYSGGVQAEWEYWVIAESNTQISARGASVYFHQ